MNSSISHFKWLIVAVAGFVAIEAVVDWAAPSPGVVRNNFLEFGFASTELLQRAELEQKFIQFNDAKPDIVQVGDSSGMHGVQPLIVESYLHGLHYLNMSLATNLGYWGYYAVAEHMMQHSGSVKALVLYFTPGGPPQPALVDASDLMASSIDREFVSPVYRLFHVPSLGLRRAVTDRVYYLNGYFNAPNRPLSDNAGFLMLRDIISSSEGWARETDLPDDHIDGIFKMLRQNDPKLANLDDLGVVRWIFPNSMPTTFNWSTLLRKTYMQIVLDRFRQLAERYHARLIVATNPVPDTFRLPAFNRAFDLVAVERALEAYHREHPNVAVLGVDYWPDERFSGFAHVGTPYAVESSRRLGRFMEQVVADIPADRHQAAQSALRAPVVLDMAASPTVYGFGPAQTLDGHAFRTIRQGRYEALIYARVADTGPQEVQISILNDLHDPVLHDLSIGVYGEAARRLPDVQRDGRNLVRFVLPLQQTQRYAGWIELTLSTRGALAWQGNDLYPDATGPELNIEKLSIADEKQPIHADD